ncbi:MAG: hypothetical protein KIS77_05025 [Saprospiraceae bacterium]|nr:hypothetical protein [Saprospiraceae bacterium]
MNFRANGTAVTFLEEMHYYPFGMLMEGIGTVATINPNKYRFNGIEQNEELGLNLGLAFYRSYDATLGRWWQVDPKHTPGQSVYNMVNNNPLRYSDFLGDTLRGVNAQSAQRTLEIIRGTFNNGPKKSSMADLFQISSDGQTFSSIDSGEFLEALEGLSTEQQALAIGYYLTINDTETNIVEVVNREEKISEYGKESLGTGYTMGADIDKADRGGRRTNANSHKGLGLVGERGENNGSYVAIVQYSKGKVGSYSDGVIRPSKPGELLAHELLGHGLGIQNFLGDGQKEAIQAGNLFLKAQGYSYYRKDHGFSDHPNPTGIPQYIDPSIIFPWRN